MKPGRPYPDGYYWHTTGADPVSLAIPHSLVNLVSNQLALASMMEMDRRMRLLLGPRTWAEREAEAVERLHPRHYPARLRAAIRLRFLFAKARVRHVIDAALDRPCEYSEDRW